MRSFYSFILVISFSFLSMHLVSAEGFYKWKDARGNIQYGDSPPANTRAKKMKMPKITVIENYQDQWKPLNDSDLRVNKVQTTRSTTKTKQVKNRIYSKLIFIAPKNNQVMKGGFGGEVTSMLSIKPPLKNGHEIIYLLDGEESSRSTSRISNFSNLQRGLHTAGAKIIDQNGDTLIVAPPVPFEIKRMTSNDEKPPLPAGSPVIILDESKENKKEVVPPLPTDIKKSEQQKTN